MTLKKFNTVKFLLILVNEEKLKEMDIPYGHRTKILKRLGLKQNDNINNPCNRFDNNVRAITKNTYEELPMGTDTVVEKNKKPYEEQYDEELQRKLFQEAVQAFRKGKREEDKDNYDKFSREKRSEILIVL